MKSYFLAFFIIYFLFSLGDWIDTRLKYDNPEGVMLCKKVLKEMPVYGYFILPGVANGCLDILVKHKEAN